MNHKDSNIFSPCTSSKVKQWSQHCPTTDEEWNLYISLCKLWEQR